MSREWLKKQMSFYDDILKGKNDKLYLAFGWEWIVIIAAIVLVFGVGKLANVGGALGKSIREFREEKDKPSDKPKLSTKENKDEKTKDEDENKD